MVGESWLIVPKSLGSSSLSGDSKLISDSAKIETSFSRSFKSGSHKGISKWFKPNVKNRFMKPTLLTLSKRDSYLNRFSKTVNHPTKNFKGDFNSQIYGHATHCYVCDNRVELNNLHCHLYFGDVKCGNCNRIITSCLKFSNVSISRCESNEKCTHRKLDWVLPPVDNLKKLWNEKDESFDKFLKSYLKSLQELSTTQPFKKAIAYCSVYLKQRFYSRSKLEFWNVGNPLSTNSNKALTTTITTTTTACYESRTHNIAVKRNLNSGEHREPTQVVPVLPENGFSNKALTTTTTTTISTCNESPIHQVAVKTNLNSKVSSGEHREYTEVAPVVPENGFYLIKKQMIEKCPNCDKFLNPQNLKFNTNNWLISISCIHCSLLIFFILNPPDGSKSKLTIVSSRY